jgi:hypothetical protein
MNYRIIIYLFHLIVVFPYLFYLGQQLRKSENEKLEPHSKVLIAVSIMGFAYQAYLLIELVLLYNKLSKA